MTRDRVIVARRSSPYLNMSGAWTIGVGGVIGIALDVLEAKKKKDRERHEAKECREISPRYGGFGEFLDSTSIGVQNPWSEVVGWYYDL